MTANRKVTASLQQQAAEARHLRRLLDTQPGCLMRIASTGEILAANDAAVELLGAEQRKFALGVPLTKWIVPDQIGAWKDFATRVLSGVRTSLETHLIAGDLRRKALLHGTPLTDHPDGVSSLLVSVHDISERMVLETAIEQLRQSAEAPRTAPSSDEFEGETEVLLDEWVADQDSLQERFDRLAAEHESALATASEASERQQRLQRELEERIEQLTVAHQSAETALAEAVASRQWIQRDFEERIERLAAAQPTPRPAGAETTGGHRPQRQLEEYQARLEALDADRISAVKQLAGAMAGRFQAAAEREAALARLDEAIAEQRRLEAQLSDAEAQVERLRAGRTEGAS